MGQTDQITDMSGLFRVAIEIAGKRRETLQRLRVESELRMQES